MNPISIFAGVFCFGFGLLFLKMLDNEKRMSHLAPMIAFSLSALNFAIAGI